MDDQLKWNLHVEHLCKKVGNMISYLARIKHFVNESALKTIFDTVILPHFDYCISHYFRVQLFSRFWTFAVIREWLISRYF